MFRFIILVFCLKFSVLVATSLAEQLTVKDKEEQLIALGFKYSNLFLKKFQSELLNAIKEGGISYAVSYCNHNVPSITKSVKSSLPKGVEFKRTSLKLRNLNNKATADDLDAISYLENKANNFFIKKSEKNPFYFYYKPIIVKGVCLNCHGDKAKMDIKVKEIIEHYYPDDKALGYKLDDLRGVLRVTIPFDLLD